MSVRGTGRPIALTLLCLALCLWLLAGVTSGAQVTAQANGQELVLVVPSGTRVEFQGHIEAALRSNVSSYGWRFSRPMYDAPGELQTNETFYAKGLYNATFEVELQDTTHLEHTLYVYVYFDEPGASWLDFWSDFPPWLYTLLAALEVVVGLGLFGATWHLKQTKVYLRQPTGLEP